MNYLKLTKEEVINGIRNKEITGTVFLTLKKSIREDKEVILEMVKQDGWMLTYCSDSIYDNIEIVLEAVKSNGLVMSFVSEQLQDNKEIVLEAVKNDMFALVYASDRLQNDKELLEVLEKGSNTTVIELHNDNKVWYDEKMEVLANIREKELLEKIVIPSRISTKKIKF